MLMMAAVLASAAQAQETPAPQRVLVMYVSPAPDYRLSVGLAEPNGDNVTIGTRLEMGPHCAWTRGAELIVPAADIAPVRDPDSAGGPDRFGVLTATMYSAMVSYRGGTPAVEDHTCVREFMTSIATRMAQNR